MAPSLLAVLLGWTTVAILVVSTDFAFQRLFPKDYVPGRFPPDWLALLSLATSFLWSAAGGWICARIARRRPWPHTATLIALGWLISGTATYLTWGRIQPWYQLALLALWPAAVALGAWLRLRSAPAESR